ncbi:MAG: TIGR03663 family protein [Anaerolineae bacterium]|nr:TIGR03663 family protein [Anaerolineae bacterium]
MTVLEDISTSTETKRPLSNLEYQLTRLLYLDGERLAYLVIFVLAVLTRFWDLGVRVMSHDESLHTRYSWGLFHGEGFTHTPLMHGPLLFHMVALNYLLFGDNDFTSRIYPAILGIVIVMMPIFLRKWLGRMGAISASVLFLISPMMLYYSRYIRMDIPAITGVLIMVISIWRYMEGQQFKHLIWLTFGQAVLFASKEVSFIYVAVFGSYLTLYFVTRLLDVRWENQDWYQVFVIALRFSLIMLVALGVVFTASGYLSSTIGGDPANPAEGAVLMRNSLDILTKILAGLLAISLLVFILAVFKGQWYNLRRFPEMDLMIVMGSLILPALTPFPMHGIKLLGERLSETLAAPPPIVTNMAAINPMATDSSGILTSVIFTAVFIIISLSAGVAWGTKTPESRLITLTDDDEEDTIEAPPDIWDWLQTILTSRWWILGGIYWLFFIFFFTTMFTQGQGLGTGIIGSLAYWLEQQEVQRGGQPWYYYILVMLPIYEFLPVILALAAGAVGIGRLIKSLNSTTAQIDNEQEEIIEASQSDAPKEGGNVQAAERPALTLDEPISFPALAFTAYWAIMFLIALSIAGEKMPWLTTHLTTPLILLGGWVTGRLLERIEWRKLWETKAWVLFALIPLFAIALTRVIAPLCTRQPNALPCNTIIPTSYQVGVFQGLDTTVLAATGVWITALIAVGATFVGLIVFGLRIGGKQILRLASLCLVGWLAFMTARAAWWAAFVNYDEATEYLVYAHSSGAVKQVLNQIEEISLKTTDGYGLRVAYDDKVSWPYSWYFRNYHNQIFYGSQPTRGQLNDAPVILAGPENWTKVEPLLGDRYYRFEYIRMWWPMQDYFELKTHPEYIRDFFSNPALQRGVWEIFYKRDYTAYAEATGKNFDLNQWPLADRMRVYIRKDTFAQVWDYGVAATEMAEAIDPYSENVRELTPDLTFGQGQLNRPHQIAVGPGDLLYVADSNNHQIAVFDQNGNFIQTFGQQGVIQTDPQTDGLNEPWGVGVAPDGTVYVADTWNSRVSEYTAEGSYIRSWGYEGAGILTDPLAFWGPRAIAVDAQGLVYLADTGNKRIQVFDEDGNFVKQIGAGGGLDGQLDEPVGIAVGEDELVYVADAWNRRVQVFTKDGMFVRQWLVEAWFAETNERPYIAVDPQNNVYITDPDAFRVIVFDNHGNYLYSFGDYTTIGLAGGITINEEGRLFLSDTAAGTIQRYTIDAP